MPNLFNLKRLLALLCFPYLLFGCALCALYTPTATAEFTFFETNSTLKSVEMKWHFSRDFIAELKTRYDVNSNGALDDSEWEHIHAILNDYVSKRNYLVTIEHIHHEDKVSILNLPTPRKAFVKEKENISYIFTFPLEIPVQENDEFSVILKDREGYFNFSIHSFTNKLDSFPATRINANLHVLFIKLQKTPLFEAPPLMPTKAVDIAPKEEKGWLALHVSRFQEHIIAMMNSMRTDHSLFQYTLFLGISFLYGLLHAAGPGHGKTLVASYFLRTNHSYTKAFGIACAIGFVHTFSAFVLTLILHLFFDLFFKAFFDDFTYYATKMSAIIILMIVAYLLFDTIKRRKKRPKILSFSTHPPSCACGACSEKSYSTDIGVVLGAGIVPCPGTVTIFIFALNTGEYFFGFLSALLMSAGMSLIILLAAVSTIFARHRFLSSSVSVYANYVSLVMMLLLGLVLLVS